jgi:hypothetical protein
MGTSEVLERKKPRRLLHTVSCQITIERAVKRILRNKSKDDTKIYF